MVTLAQTLLLETGLLACVIVVVVAQLTPQIVASIYPVRSGLATNLPQVQFMQLMVSMPAYWACIALETTGITHFTWILSDLSSRLGIRGMKDETVEINRNEDTLDVRRKGMQNTGYTQDGA